jgi:hypothetical protein
MRVRRLNYLELETLALTTFEDCNVKYCYCRAGYPTATLCCGDAWGMYAISYSNLTNPSILRCAIGNEP